MPATSTPYSWGVRAARESRVSEYSRVGQHYASPKCSRKQSHELRLGRNNLSLNELLPFSNANVACSHWLMERVHKPFVWFILQVVLSLCRGALQIVIGPHYSLVLSLLHLHEDDDGVLQRLSRVLY